MASPSPLDKPLGTARKIRIITIGAGASGLNLVRTLRLHLEPGSYVHQIYEKNPCVGGTWYENRYPGCRCDIPSHNYQFSWRPNPEWSSFFSPAEEIGAYLCKICDEEDMAREIRLGCIVMGAEWHAAEAVWKVKLRDVETGEEFEDESEVLINAGGILNNWKWPNIPGLHDFKGELVHSAAWPKDFNYKGKKAAVIGNGSSGIQIVPELQPHVEKLVHTVRTPTWLVPPRIQLLSAGKTADIMSQLELTPEGDFTAGQIERFKSDPDFYKKFVKLIEQDVNGNFPIVLKDMPLAKETAMKLAGYMKMMLQGNEELCKALIPDFAVGCRRLTPGIGYLESLQAENTRVLTDHIARVLPQGIETVTGEVIELDAIVCATGFDVSFCPRFPVIGTEDNLQDRWQNNIPKAYMSCAVPGFPNYFTFLGPNAPIGHGSVFTISEHIAKYLVRIIRKLQMENVAWLSPTAAATEELHEHTQRFMPRTAWAAGCSSWFKGGKVEGPVTALHPGGRIHFFHMLEAFRGEDFEYGYREGGRYGYLGNGFSTKEGGGQNSTWYLDEPDKLY